MRIYSKICKYNKILIKIIIIKVSNLRNIIIIIRVSSMIKMIKNKKRKIILSENCRKEKVTGWINLERNLRNLLDLYLIWLINQLYLNKISQNRMINYINYK